MNILNVKTLFKTMIQNRTPITPFLWGPHGCGKSSGVRQLGKELGYRVLTVILSQKEAIDLSGVLYTFVDPDLGMSVTASHPPQWFADAVKRGNLIIFLDEFNMARREVTNAAFQLVLDRELNGVPLPETVFIVCAGNPEDERYDVTPMSESLRDRFMHLKVTSDTTSWLTWASQPGSPIHPSVVSFISQVPDAVRFQDTRDEKFPVEIKHSERSWERVSQIQALPLPQEIKLECFRGIVGPDLALAFLAQFGADAPLSAQEILNPDRSVQERIVKWTTAGNLRIDLLTLSVNALLAECKSNPGTVKNASSAFAFLVSLPGDAFSLAISGLNQIPGWSTEILKHDRLKKKIEQIRELGKSAA